MQRSNRDQVLDAVADSVRDLGARRTTMTEVARRAELSRSTVYTHFPDATAALAALLTRELLALLAPFEDEPHEGLDGRELIVQRAVHLAARIPDHPVIARLLELDGELLVPYLVRRLGSSQRAILDAVTADVTRGQRDGSVRDGEPALIAFTTFLTVQSFVVSARIAEAEHGREAVLGELALVLDRILAPPPSALGAEAAGTAASAAAGAATRDATEAAGTATRDDAEAAGAGMRDATGVPAAGAS